MNENGLIQLAEPIETLRTIADSFPASKIGQEAYKHLIFLLGVREGVERLEQLELVIRRALASSHFVSKEQLLDPNNPLALMALGSALSNHAKQTTKRNYIVDLDTESQRAVTGFFFEEANAKFRSAKKLLSTSSDLFFMWGRNLARYAKYFQYHRNFERALLCFEQACNMFMEALLLEPSHEKSLVRWAQTLDALSYLCPSRNQITLLYHAFIQQFNDYVNSCGKGDGNCNLKPLIALSLSKNPLIRKEQPIVLIEELTRHSNPTISQEAYRNLRFLQFITPRRMKYRNLTKVMIEALESNGFSKEMLEAHCDDIVTIFLWTHSPITELFRLPCEARNIRNEAKSFDLDAILIHSSPKSLFSNIVEVFRGPDTMVFTCNSRKRGTPLALKKIRNYSRNMELAKCEVWYLKQLRHNNFAHLLDVYLHNDELWMVMEYTAAGLLSGFLVFHSTLLEVSGLPEAEIAYICKEILKALVYLHRKGLMYRDLRMESIMLHPDGNVWIADLGFNVELAYASDEQWIINQRKFCAPEILKQEPYGFKADVWSLGCICIQMAEPEEQETKEPLQCAYELVYQNKIPRLRGDHWSNRFKDFLDHCLNPDPYQRLTSEQLLSHPFLDFACSKERIAEAVKTAFWFNTT
jgi:tetratricopeptide (TPR) repeat protein